MSFLYYQNVGPNFSSSPYLGVLMALIRGFLWNRSSYSLRLDFDTFTYPPWKHLACVTILHTKMHYHIGIYFQSGVSQLEKYGPYRNWTVDYTRKSMELSGTNISPGFTQPRQSFNNGITSCDPTGALISVGL